MFPTVSDLLRAEGLGPHLTFPGYAAAVRLADAVSYTIERPIIRASFIAEVAHDFREWGAAPFKGLEDDANSLADTAENQRPTPCGSTELWGSLVQHMYHKGDF